jgi:DNA-binding IscR family transcriptional regulator
VAGQKEISASALWLKAAQAALAFLYSVTLAHVAQQAALIRLLMATQSIRLLRREP